MDSLAPVVSASSTVRSPSSPSTTRRSTRFRPRCGIYCHGLGFPRPRGGPMFYADRVGLPVLLARIEEYRRLGDHWRPAPLLARLAVEGRGFHEAAADGGGSGGGGGAGQRGA